MSLRDVLFSRSPVDLDRTVAAGRGRALTSRDRRWHRAASDGTLPPPDLEVLGTSSVVPGSSPHGEKLRQSAHPSPHAARPADAIQATGRSTSSSSRSSSGHCRNKPHGYTPSEAATEYHEVSPSMGVGSELKAGRKSQSSPALREAFRSDDESGWRKLRRKQKPAHVQPLQPSSTGGISTATRGADEGSRPTKEADRRLASSERDTRTPSAPSGPTSQSGSRRARRGHPTHLSVDAEQPPARSRGPGSDGPVTGAGGPGSKQARAADAKMIGGQPYLRSGAEGAALAPRAGEAPPAGCPLSPSQTSRPTRAGRTTPRAASAINEPVLPALQSVVPTSQRAQHPAPRADGAQPSRIDTSSSSRPKLSNSAAASSMLKQGNPFFSSHRFSVDSSAVGGYEMTLPTHSNWQLDNAKLAQAAKASNTGSEERSKVASSTQYDERTRTALHTPPLRQLSDDLPRLSGASRSSGRVSPRSDIRRMHSSDSVRLMGRHSVRRLHSSEAPDTGRLSPRNGMRRLHSSDSARLIARHGLRRLHSSEAPDSGRLSPRNAIRRRHSSDSGRLTTPRTGIRRLHSSESPQHGRLSPSADLRRHSGEKDGHRAHDVSLQHLHPKHSASLSETSRERRQRIASARPLPHQGGKLELGGSLSTAGAADRDAARQVDEQAGDPRAKASLQQGGVTSSATERTSGRSRASTKKYRRSGKSSTSSSPRRTSGSHQNRFSDTDEAGDTTAGRPAATDASAPPAARTLSRKPTGSSAVSGSQVSGGTEVTAQSNPTFDVSKIGLLATLPASGERSVNSKGDLATPQPSSVFRAGDSTTSSSCSDAHHAASRRGLQQAAKPQSKPSADDSTRVDNAPRAPLAYLKQQRLVVPSASATVLSPTGDSPRESRRGGLLTRTPSGSRRYNPRSGSCLNLTQLALSASNASASPLLSRSSRGGEAARRGSAAVQLAVDLRAQAQQQRQLGRDGASGPLLVLTAGPAADKRGSAFGRRTSNTVSDYTSGSSSDNSSVESFMRTTDGSIILAIETHRKPDVSPRQSRAGSQSPQDVPHIPVNDSYSSDGGSPNTTLVQSWKGRRGLNSSLRQRRASNRESSPLSKNRGSVRQFSTDSAGSPRSGARRTRGFNVSSPTVRRQESTDSPHRQNELAGDSSLNLRAQAQHSSSALRADTKLDSFSTGFEPSSGSRVDHASEYHSAREQENNSSVSHNPLHGPTRRGLSDKHRLSFRSRQHTSVTDGSPLNHSPGMRQVGAGYRLLSEPGSTWTHPASPGAGRTFRSPSGSPAASHFGLNQSYSGVSASGSPGMLSASHAAAPTNLRSANLQHQLLAKGASAGIPPQQLAILAGLTQAHGMSPGSPLRNNSADDVDTPHSLALSTYEFPLQKSVPFQDSMNSLAGAKERMVPPLPVALEEMCTDVLQVLQESRDEELLKADDSYEALRRRESRAERDLDAVVALLEEVENTWEWALINEHCEILHKLQEVFDDTDIEVILHDLEERGIVWMATRIDAAMQVKESEAAKKLRVTDVAWRRRCLDLEDELENSRAHLTQLLADRRIAIGLPPLRWLQIPFVAEVISWVVLEDAGLPEGMARLVKEWEEVAGILQEQVGTVHGMIARVVSSVASGGDPPAMSPHAMNFIESGWRNVCYTDRDDLRADDGDSALGSTAYDKPAPAASAGRIREEPPDAEDLPLPQSTRKKERPQEEEARALQKQSIEEEELPPKVYEPEQERVADRYLDEELPSPKRSMVDATKRWKKAGRNLRNAAFIWKKTAGINVEKSKAQSATAEPEVDLAGAAVRFRRLWKEKKDETTFRRFTILDELVQNLKVPRMCDTPELKLLALAQAVHMLNKTKGEIAPRSVKGKKRDRLEVFVMALYTMAGFDIDRMLLFPGVPDPDEDMDSYLQRHSKSRNSAPFREMNVSVRQAVLKVDETREHLLEESEKAWLVMGKWVKTIGLLYALCHDTHPDPSMDGGGFAETCPSLFRGLAGLPEDVLLMHDRLKQGSTLHWPAPSSCAKDEEVATSYINGEFANASKSKGGTALYTVRDVRRGIPLSEISQYPQEAEILVAPFTTFKVGQPKSRIPGLKSSLTKQVVVEWVNTDPLGQNFSDSCLAEAEAASTVLAKLAMAGLVLARLPNQSLGIAFSSCLTVMEIKPSTPAASADAQRFIGYRLVECNGRRVTCTKELKDAVGTSEVVCLQFVSGLEQLTEVQKTVDEYPQPCFVFEKTTSAGTLAPTERDRHASHSVSDGNCV
ncbi:hypothetical protein DIPPA_25264 [Diplonema papillatum]|nr:hypothetical protein DIPPA_25264 [Diplonema papillatum]